MYMFFMIVLRCIDGLGMFWTFSVTKVLAMDCEMVGVGNRCRQKAQEHCNCGVCAIVLMRLLPYS